ncbi:TIGR03618 family F420-dependent PPOX class oxidoreductase [Pseudonocardia hydrocarbonoxydans]|uniref:PPOX class F420-dependent enzyme n=1 Tax=Pseudonocardia hydrocarbonoxydans TaxID=76726 RepID=A0A4Y3WGN2_9PSEU|nr:TIGR03618 family F420-dependent PPOX class oxidoreductase [Pseudonocardia hydrocarbonoxydans]GEC17835.1 PPOX class F420-dependent enzyme [Pseudonocardia hydrocarbonoxydans]
MDPHLLDLFTDIPGGTLITLKRDGRAQSSVVTHAFDPDTRTLRISVTEGRAKTRNLRRDPRCSYQVTRPDLSAYAVGEATAELTAAAADPHDDTVEALVAYYRDVRGEHPDWDEYRAAMVAERRVLLTAVVDRVYGRVPPAG